METRGTKKRRINDVMYENMRSNLKLAFNEYHFGNSNSEKKKKIRKIILDESLRGSSSLNILNEDEQAYMYHILTNMDPSNLYAFNENEVKKISETIIGLAQRVNTELESLEKLMNRVVKLNIEMRNKITPIKRGYSIGKGECETSARKCIGYNSQIPRAIHGWWVDEYTRLWREGDIVTATFLISCLLVTREHLFELSEKKNFKRLRRNRVIERSNGPFTEYTGNLYELLSKGGDENEIRKKIYNDRKVFLKQFTQNLEKLEFIDSQKIILPMFLIAFGRLSGSCIDNTILKYKDTQGDVFLENSHFACIKSSCPLTRGTEVRTYPTWPTSKCKDHIRVPPGPQAFLVLTFSSMIRHINNPESVKRICPVFNTVLEKLCPDPTEREFVRYVVMGRCKPPAK
jgi:hypothetical protein